jgi:hypothetical protein
VGEGWGLPWLGISAWGGWFYQIQSIILAICGFERFRKQKNIRMSNSTLLIK